MPERLVWYTGDRLPVISENITSGGVAVDLSSSTVKFKMRAIGESTLTVDASATIASPATAGNVSYAWAAADVDTAGEYLGWWEVTTGGKIQAVGEVIIEIRDHAAITQAYVELEDFKQTADLSGFTFADGDAKGAIIAASRAIDEVCGRRFYADSNSSQVRYYSPSRPDAVTINDLVTLTSIKLDSGDDGTFETTLTSGQYVLEPLNAAADGKPYTRIRLRPTAFEYFTTGYPKSVEVTGKFGWSAVPQAITEATKILATQILKRKREAPFGVISQGLDGAAVYIARSDPQVQMLVEPYVRLDPDE